MLVKGMCKNIIEKVQLSKPLIIYDLSETRTQEIHMKLQNTKTARSVTEAASQSDIIFYSVTNDEAVNAVLKQILQTNVKGKLIVDCSTVSPDTSNEEARKVEALGGDFVACPAFGAAAMADAGQLVLIPAGKPNGTEKVKHFCVGVMGKAIIDLTGEEPGKATMLKLIGNSFVLNMVAALSEGHVVAEKSGLGTQYLHKFIQIFFPGPYTAYSERMLSGDYFKRTTPLFSVDLARKDARHAQSIASSAGLTMKNVEVADGYLKTVQEYRGPMAEMAAMYGAKRLEAGLPFEN
jgi:3-hydroxyisobutyrate dehydrogenase-like beta-hydroxyacid dehydrogenase